LSNRGLEVAQSVMQSARTTLGLLDEQLGHCERQSTTGRIVYFFHIFICFSFFFFIHNNCFYTIFYLVILGELVLDSVVTSYLQLVPLFIDTKQKQKKNKLRS
jgi:uncharacterized membrane-anchored protein YitT (DUF2179 family)